MYRTIIRLKKPLSEEYLYMLHLIIEGAFKNRAGRISNTSKEPYQFVFEGSEHERGCLQLGILALDEDPEFKMAVKEWKWEDVDPDENCDLIAEFAKEIY